ncbi:S-layer homology domain-containing protein [Crocosphaera chwakensis]|uniref:S-layer region-like protein n=1 Tax=Crocosphaera chwakensis CCY0110 TaxID=391612 RepID=A3IRA1_9CHRO|nr:S-layer homology domain-containing protein [Crocosphaera chwakensis]EAZ91091.1 S-layer region-like protein [Crocosphaera chwakensis CCY0110]
MYRYIILSLLFPFITACSSISDLESRFSPNPELAEKKENVTPSTLEIPNTFPDTIPQYSNSELQEVSENLTEEQGLIRWSSSDSIGQISGFYQEQFNNNDWEISQPFNEENNTLIAQKDGLEVQLSFLSASNGNTDYSIRYQTLSDVTASNAEEKPTSSQTKNNENSSLNNVPQSLQSYVADVRKLDTVNLSNTDNKTANESGIINRRTYARWLVETYNKFYENTPAKQIRLGVETSKPAFSDVSSNDPDFAVIQGLAEAGIIPSPLTGNSSASLFRPDNPLTREDLVTWKVPLDMGKGLPQASIDNIKETWGFQDTTKIDTKAIQALYADFQNGEQSNVRRIFGYTTLFQPNKGVTLAEAAASLWYFGYQGDGLSAEDVLSINNE